MRAPSAPSFRIDEHVQEPAARLHPEVVDGGDDGDRDGGPDARVRRVPAENAERVLRESDRDGGEPAALDQDERRPAEEERDERVIGLPQVDVLAARGGVEGRELREGKRAGESDRSADGPRRENETGRREPLRDDGRHDEDARADDSADDDHRRVEAAERAAEAQRRENTFKTRPVRATGR